MPKKYNPNYTKPSNSYVHPSLQNSRPSSSTPAPPQSVTERIQQLRREQAPRASTERRNEITDAVTQRTIPPALRRLLNIPEVDPPRQKPGTRPRHVRATRPPPGPAPPTSWLDTSRHAPAVLRQLAKRDRTAEDGYSSPQFCSLAMLVENGDVKSLPPGRSLVHSTLKTFASSWEDLVEYEQHNLGALPASLKETLLTYLTRYGPSGCLDITSFKVLFLDENGGTGSDEIRFLDLTNLLNERFTLNDLYKYMTRQKPSIPDKSDLSIADSKGKTEASPEVAESWEDEADTVTSSIPKSIAVSRFPLLTRLSLAHPGQWASWPQLLTLSAKLHTLTHLSLAYWPTPSSTPNAATVSMVSQHARPVTLGGTSIYSELDDDWHEAANILRRLSLNTYSLQWLDLEGCTWVQALTFGSPETSRHLRRPSRTTPSDEWVKAPEQIGPDWTTSWSQILYLNLSQGWIPQDTADIQRIPAGVLAVQLLGWLREQQRLKKLPPKKPNVQPWDVDEWMEKEKVAMSVGAKIQRLRKAANAPYCKVDHGWDQRFGSL